MAENTVRTVYGAYLQTCKHLGVPFVVKDHTTLNEKWSIQAGVLPDAGVYPNLGYFCIGNGGHTITVGADNTPVMKPQQFKATNASLYRPIPFVIRALGNDLSGAERAKYCGRRLETIKGTTYIVYYIKRIETTNVVPTMNLTTVTNGVSVTTPFVPDSSNLNPTPPAISTPQIITADGSYVSATAQLSVILNEIDTSEFLNAIMIIYGDINYAMISEMALVSGIDKQVTVLDPGGTQFNMKEVIAAQVCDLANVGAALQFNPEGTTFALDIGATEPLTKVST